MKIFCNYCGGEIWIYDKQCPHCGGENSGNIKNELGKITSEIKKTPTTPESKITLIVGLLVVAMSGCLIVSLLVIGLIR